jgi:CDP-diacylglycerol--glycerol-3-phosphate 3-phosphatidyltransferase
VEASRERRHPRNSGPSSTVTIGYSPDHSIDFRDCFPAIASGYRLMTLANKITVARICLIPVFVWSAWNYGLSVVRSAPAEGFHTLAIVTFCLAAITDGLDGFVARRWNQQSRLGSILDPIADKALMFGALITLSSSGWRPSLPWFFPCIVISRDLVLGIGFLVLTKLSGEVEVRPSWIGKTATVLQIGCILWVLLRIPAGLTWLIGLASLFTIVSGISYLLGGIRRLLRLPSS